MSHHKASLFQFLASTGLYSGSRGYSMILLYSSAVMVKPNSSPRIQRRTGAAFANSFWRYSPANHFLTSRLTFPSENSTTSTGTGRLVWPLIWSCTFTVRRISLACAAIASACPGNIFFALTWLRVVHNASLRLFAVNPACPCISSPLLVNGIPLLSSSLSITLKSVGHLLFYLFHQLL